MVHFRVSFLKHGLMTEQVTVRDPIALLRIDESHLQFVKWLPVRYRRHAQKGHTDGQLDESCRSAVSSRWGISTS
jgi:hypothetical protein